MSTRAELLELFLPDAQGNLPKEMRVTIHSYLRRYPFHQYLFDEFVSAATLVVLEAVDRAAEAPNGIGYLCTAIFHKLIGTALADHMVDPRKMKRVRESLDDGQLSIIELAPAREDRSDDFGIRDLTKAAELAATIIGPMVAGRTLGRLANACKADPLQAVVVRRVLKDAAQTKTPGSWGRVTADLNLPDWQARQWEASIGKLLGLSKKRKVRHEKFGDTPEEQQTLTLIRELHEGGMRSTSRIARELNRRGLKTKMGKEFWPATVQNQLKKLKIVRSAPGDRAAIAAEIREAAIKLRGEGLTHRAIAKKLGISSSSVSYNLSTPAPSNK